MIDFGSLVSIGLCRLFARRLFCVPFRLAGLGEPASEIVRHSVRDLLRCEQAQFYRLGPHLMRKSATRSIE